LSATEGEIRGSSEEAEGGCTRDKSCQESFDRRSQKSCEKILAKSSGKNFSKTRRCTKSRPCKRVALAQAGARQAAVARSHRTKKKAPIASV
jgi:hypothetical protein